MADGLTGGRSGDEDVSDAVMDDVRSGYQAPMLCKLPAKPERRRIVLKIVAHRIRTVERHVDCVMETVMRFQV